MITYDDFAKLQMVLGKILTVEAIADADKLLRLTVDVGETRTTSNCFGHPYIF